MKEEFLKLGKIADKKLKAKGLVLTQGGEPTFVPKDTSEPEWNVAALGEEKIYYAKRLSRHLVDRAFPGAVILQSFGKQYPGEPLPRWHIGVFASRSGKVLWKDLTRLRLDQDKVEPCDPETPGRFLNALAEKLGLGNRVIPVFEDFEAKLKQVDPEAAKRILPRFSREDRAFRVVPLEAELESTWEEYFAPAGWVLPLEHTEKGWETDTWSFPDGRELVLIPGDSPVGLRLPLNKLPEDATKKGLTVEVKDGECLLFLPPVDEFEHFCELVHTIEEIAKELKLPPIRIEGYAPPDDEDLYSIALTSDPGVLEVNLPPFDNWAEYDQLIRDLFACAKDSGLYGSKFQLSGRKVSTGGGAHIILGGPDLGQNPFLEQPSILSSFLRFIQNHPAISYAFSGLFTGPSSQAPRVDESAYEVPYELEISLQAIEEIEAPAAAWLLDAILRNLLMDWNGNTHRAELSVDKFFNGNLSSGQKGLIEFRAFEMVPEVEALLAPNLLLRCLASCFAEKAYTEPLVDWGLALHDRFALPYFLRKDLESVLKYLDGFGLSFPPQIFDFILDFRFPLVVSKSLGSTTWTLRQAIEPWPVMGEHQGTGRVVDSTTDRLELLVKSEKKGSLPKVVINGLLWPLVEVEEGAIGAVRYRLFDNPWGLQPQISAHTPLTIAFLDENDCVLDAFEYHSWKRDSDEYDGLPKTEKEAQARVDERLVQRDDLVGGTLEYRSIVLDQKCPFTLDLRKF